MFDEFFSKASDLRSRGVPFATAVVVRSEAPTSGKPGDKAIVTLDGVMYGWIGGSCAQPTVIEEARRAIADGKSRVIRLSPDGGDDSGSRRSTEGVEERLMPCYSGGTLEIYIEPQQPQLKLVVVGHLPVAQALAHLGKAMSYRVIAVTPTSEAASMAHADEVLTDVAAIADHASAVTYIVVATHGHFDEQALEYALRTKVPYVGLVASRTRTEAVRTFLASRGFSEEETARIEAPAGLDIGARRGDEIALSIIAKIVQHRRDDVMLDWPASVEIESPSLADETRNEVARDPVCGMDVTVSGARHRHVHAGRTYYFCCGGCQSRFATEPESYLAGDRKPA